MSTLEAGRSSPLLGLVTGTSPCATGRERADGPQADLLEVPDGTGRPVAEARVCTVAGNPVWAAERRLASSDQWVALAVRDRGCVVPGCDRLPTWCHAHDLRLWEKGGLTDMANLCLVCTKHHHLIHDQRWKLKSNPGG